MNWLLFAEAVTNTVIEKRYEPLVACIAVLASLMLLGAVCLWPAKQITELGPRCFLLVVTVLGVICGTISVTAVGLEDQLTTPAYAVLSGLGGVLIGNLLARNPNKHTPPPEVI